LRILFDQNVPRALGRHLGPHQITRSAERGWQELRNGDLLKAAEEDGFELLLTCDRNLEHQQRVVGRGVAIIALSTNNWPLIRIHAEEVAKVVESARPGTYFAVDCGVFRRKRPARRNDM
jgi:predicted nuclease of predicted toxin-antitoxin system